MASVLWVDRDELETAKPRLQEGGHYSLQISPYNLPHSIHGTYNREKELLEIDLYYIDQEEKDRKPISADHGIQLFVGEHSRKILKITIPLKTVPQQGDGVIDSLRKAIHEALQNQIRILKTEKRSPRLNFELVNEVLNNDDYFQLLSSELITPS